MRQWKNVALILIIYTCQTSKAMQQTRLVLRAKIVNTNFRLLSTSNLSLRYNNQEYQKLCLFNRGHSLLIKIQFFPMIFRIATPYFMCSAPFPPRTMLADNA